MYRSNYSQENSSSQNLKGGRTGFKNSANLFLDVMDDHARWTYQPVPPPAEQTETTNRTIGGYNIPFLGKTSLEAAPQPEQKLFSTMVQSGNVLGLDRALPAYDIIVAGVEQKKEEGNSFLGMKGSYIVYVLQTTRLRDSTTAIAYRRYSAIRTFFEDLVARGIIPKYVASPFPPKETVGHSSDVQGNFIARRRIEIQAYLRRVFSSVASLWELSEVKDFFALDTLKYGARYVPPPDQEPLPQPSENGSSTWKPIALASQAAASISEKLGLGDSKGSVDEADPSKVRLICEMGFPEAQVIAALQSTKNNVQLATELIMSGAMRPPPGGWNSTSVYTEPAYSRNAESSPVKMSKTPDWLSMPPPELQPIPANQPVPAYQPPPSNSSWVSASPSSLVSAHSSGLSGFGNNFSSLGNLNPTTNTARTIGHGGGSYASRSSIPKTYDV